MEIEESKEGLVSFKQQVELTPIQKRMAQGAAGRLNIGITNHIKIGEIS